MTNDAPTRENNLILRQVIGMRRDRVAVSVTNARVIELLGRMNMRLDAMSERFDGPSPALTAAFKNGTAT
jgi:hypothetical protein